MPRIDYVSQEPVAAGPRRTAAAPTAWRRSRHVVATLAVTLAAAIVLSGCSTRSAQTEDVDAASGSLAEPIVITDQRGVTHTFTEPIERIATTVIPAPSMITAIDQSYDRIVGVNESTIKRDTGSAFATMFPQALETTAISGADFVPNVETIIDLQPDVVIQWADQGDDATFIAPIEAAGIPVIGLTYGTQADLETWIEMFSTLLGQEERGEQLLEVLHDTIAELDGFAAEQTDAPSSLFLRAAGDGGYNAGMSSIDGYMNTWMTASGGTNVGQDAIYSSANATSVEQLIEWNPDVIFVSSMTALTPADVMADQALADITAVKQNRVYAVPSGGFWWDPPSAESNLTMRWAQEALFGETAPATLRDEMREHYEFLYGYQLSDDEIDGVLRLELNSGASGYDRFAR